MSTAAPLPYAPVPPTHEELALTQRFLTPARDAVEAFLLQVRAGTDAALLGSGALVRRARAYPVGYCLEIADHVYAALPGHLARPA
ncbi:MAG TPA: hypothetical protein VEB20_21565, partial [Azospirillaceae bacterium]|nr:hypothetical protein [Azospirillaceae bacterium]